MPQQDDEYDEIVVAPSELKKMTTLLDTLYLVDAAWQNFKEAVYQPSLNEGVAVEFEFDWRSFSRLLAPEVLIAMATDPQKGKVFHAFPAAAVLPRSGQFVDLTRGVSLTVEANDDAKAEVDVLGALNSLATHAETLDGGKRENAMKQLSILRRILK